MHSASKVPATVAGVAMAAVAAGTVAYVMNHTTAAQRRRAIRRTASRVGDAVNYVADSMCRNLLG